jgi:hypothetical protein
MNASRACSGGGSPFRTAIRRALQELNGAIIKGIEAITGDKSTMDANAKIRQASGFN